MGHHGINRGSSPIMTCHDGASRNQSWIITNHDVPWWGITESVVDHHQSWHAMMGHHGVSRGSSPNMMCQDEASRNQSGIITNHDVPWWHAMMGNHEIHRRSSPNMSCYDGASRNQSWITTKDDEESRNPSWIITNGHATWCGITKSIMCNHKIHHCSSPAVTKSNVDDHQ